MSTSSPSTLAEIQELQALAAKVREIADRLHRSGEAPGVADQAVQELLTAGVQLYSQKRSADQELSPFVEHTITATDVSIVATGMLEAVDLQLFELTLWHGWGRP